MRGPRRAAALPAALFVCLAFPSLDLIGRSVRPQDSQAPVSIKERLDEADKLAQQRNYEQARELYEQAARDARAEHDGLLESRALVGRARILQNESKYPEAQQCLERALELAEAGGDKAAAARVANSLGVLMENLGRREEARTWYARAASAADAAGVPRLKIRVQLNRARLESSVRDREADYREAAEAARQLGERELEADALHSWGDTLLAEGEYTPALEKFVHASTIYADIGDRDDLARVYTSMGRLNRAVGRAAEAIPFYEKALTIQRELGDKTGMVQSLNAMGVAYRALDNLRSSADCYEKAYALAIETDSPRVIDFARASLAASLMDRGEWARAAGLLEQVLRAGLDSHAGYRHGQLAWAYQNLGRLDDARRHADLGVLLSSEDVRLRASLLLRRAEVRDVQGDLTGALADALDSVRTVEEMRAKLVPLDYLKQGFSQQYQLAHSCLIGLYHRMGEPAKALAVAELTRARAFLDLLATREVQLKAADEAEVVALRHAAAELQGLGMDALVDAKATRPAPVSLTPEKAAALRKLQSARPELLSLVAARPSGATEIAAVAARLHSVILSYWVASDALFVWAVQPSGKVDLRRVEVTEKTLASLVSSASSLASPGGTAAKGVAPSKASWQTLYRLLILPVRQFLPPRGTRLTIVPHGPLMRLSFAALADANGRYLLEDYPLHYAPAAALLEFTARKAPPQDDPRRFLLVADPELPPPPRGEEALPRLPGARDEVRRIARLLPPGTATILQGQAADERTVAEGVSHVAVVHLATHGIARDDQPLDSYLALSAPPGAPADGRLTAQEIYGLGTPAALVVLSACRSGGDRMTGEGIAALARAFFYAGTPSLVVSLWNVADQAAQRLLPDFYRSWLQGRGKVEALRAAQLRLIADLRAGRVMAHTPAGDIPLPEQPILWAGFVLLGEP